MPSDILVDITSLSSGAAPETWGTVPGLSASSISVKGTDSVLILVAQVPLLDEGDATAEFRFKVNGSVTGSPINTAFTDNTHLVAGVHPMTMTWAIDGLSGGSNSFSVEWQDIVSSPNMDTAREQSFQIIEISGGEATILVDMSSSGSATSPSTWADLFGSADVTVAGTDSVLLLMGTVPLEFSEPSDDAADFQFSVDDTREGAITTGFKDATNEGSGWSGMHIVDGVSAGTHSFELQWQTRVAAIGASTSRLRTFQVVEINNNASLRVDVNLTSSATCPASYADMTGMTGTYTPVSSTSIHLIAGNFVPANASGGTAESTTQYRLAVGGTRVGSELTTFVDNQDEVTGLVQIWAETGLTGSQTFSWQWEDLGNDEVATADTARNRTFFVVELEQVIYKDVPVKTTIESEVIFKDVPVKTTIESETIFKDVPAKTTIESETIFKDVPVKTSITAPGIIFKDVPVKTTIEALIFKDVPVKTSIDILNFKDVPVKTTIQVLVFKDVPVKTTIESETIFKDVPVKTTIEAVIFKDIPVKTSIVAPTYKDVSVKTSIIEPIHKDVSVKTSIEGDVQWFDNDWSCRKKITIDNTKVGDSTTHVNFPVLINLTTDSNLSSTARSDGFDILFTSDDGKTKLDYERVLYVSGTGQLIAWVEVNVPSWVDTDIYMYYGNGSATDQQNKTGTWNSNYKGVWHFQEASGNAKDSTTHNTDGTLTGDPTQGVTGQIGNAYNFDNSTDQVSMGDPVDGHLDFASDLTVSMWINFNSGGGPRRPIEKGVFAGGAGYSFELISLAQGMKFEAEDADGDSVDTSRAAVSTGTWIYFVGQIDVNNDKIRIFKNGVQDNDDDLAPVDSSLANSEPFLVSHTSQTANAIMDEIRVSDITHSPGWILTEFNNQNSPSTFYSLAPEECLVFKDIPVKTTVDVLVHKDVPTKTTVQVLVFKDVPVKTTIESEIVFKDVSVKTTIDILNFKDVPVKTTIEAVIFKDVPVKTTIESEVIFKDVPVKTSIQVLIFKDVPVKTTIESEVIFKDAPVKTSIDILVFKDVPTKTSITPTILKDVPVKTSIVSANANDWFGNDWTCRKKIAITPVKVTGTETDFPVLINLPTDSDLSGTAQASGDDIVFTSSDGTTKFNHELEKYVDGTGELVAWVKVTSLSSTAPTEIYMYYGNSGVGNQENITGTWDSSFKGVWHLAEGGTGTRFDSTLNNNDATPGSYNGDEATSAGQINGADLFDRTNILDTSLTLSTIDATFTVSAWVKFAGAKSDLWSWFVGEQAGGGGEFFIIGKKDADNKLHYRFKGLNGDTGVDVSVPIADGNWHLITFTYNGTTGKLFFDGADTGSSVTGTANFTGSGDLRIGGRIGFATENWDGTIDEVRMSNPVRSDNWIKTGYNNQSSPSTFHFLSPEECIIFKDVPVKTTVDVLVFKDVPVKTTVDVLVFKDVPVKTSIESEVIFKDVSVKTSIHVLVFKDVPVKTSVQVLVFKDVPVKVSIDEPFVFKDVPVKTTIESEVIFKDVPVKVSIDILNFKDVPVKTTIEAVIFKDVPVKATIESEIIFKDVPVKTTIEAVIFKDVPVKTAIESEVIFKDIPVKTSIDIVNFKDVPVKTTIESEVIFKDIPVKTSIDIVNFKDVPVKTTIEAIVFKDVPIKTSIIEPFTFKDVLIKTTIESEIIFKDVPVKTSIDIGAFKDISVKTTIESEIIFKDVPVKTTIHVLVFKDIPVKTSIESETIFKDISVKTTIESEIVFKDVPVKTTIHVLVFKDIPVKTSIESEVIFKDVPVKITIHVLVFKDVPVKTSIEAVIFKDVPVKTTIESEIIFKDVLVKTSIDIINFKDVPVKTTIESEVIFKDVPVKTNIESAVVFKDVPVKTTIESETIFKDVPVKTTIESEVIFKDVPVKTTIESEAIFKDVPVKTSIESAATFKDVSVKTTIESEIVFKDIPVKTTLDIINFKDVPVKTSIVIVTVNQITKTSDARIRAIQAITKTSDARIRVLAPVTSLLTVDLDDVVMHNSHNVVLVKRNPGTFERDRFIKGEEFFITIRAYIFVEKLIREFPEEGPGEITDHELSMAVSSRWLTIKSVSIQINDGIIFDDRKYEIVGYSDNHFHNRIRVYQLKKLVGFEETAFPPLDQPLTQASQVVTIVGATGPSGPTGPAAPVAFGDITDVEFSTLVLGQVVEWDGTSKWRNVAHDHTIVGLTDTNITSLVNNDILVYNLATDKFVNQQNAPITDIGSIFWQDSVINLTTSIPPGSPTTGDRYVVATGGSGLWSGHDKEIAEWDGTVWVFTSPLEGMKLWDQATNEYFFFVSSVWTPFQITSLAGTDSATFTINQDVTVTAEATTLTLKNASGVQSTLLSSTAGKLTITPNAGQVVEIASNLVLTTNNLVLTGDIASSGSRAANIFSTNVDTTTIVLSGNLSSSGSRAATLFSTNVDTTTIVLSGNLSSSGSRAATLFATTVDATSFVGITTDMVTEASNLYFTNERVDDRVAVLIQDGTGITWTYNDIANTLTGVVTLAPFSTTNLSEGTNLYFMNERVDDRVAVLIQDGIGITWTYNDIANTLTGVVSLAPFSTTNLSEGTNLYFTDERVDDRVAVLIQDGIGITWTYNDTANTLTGVISLAPFSTTNLSEGSNLYFTDERVDDRVAVLIQDGTGITWTYNDPANTLTGVVSLAPFSTTNLSEGSNLYFTDERVDDRVAVLIQDGTGITWTYNDPANTLTGVVSLAPFSTTNLSEGTNLYYTDARVDTRLDTNQTITGNWTFSNVVVGTTPTLGTHLATKDYVDSLSLGLDWQDSVLDKDLATPPGFPSTNDRYIVASGGTGAWSGQDDNIAEWNGSSWIFITPTEGSATWVEDEDVLYVFNGTAWVKFGSTVTHNNLSGLQGGAAGEFYHLQLSAYNNLLNQDQALLIASSPAFAGLSLTGNLVLAANSITGTSVDINNAELQQLSNIGTATISGAQWGFLGALTEDVQTHMNAANPHSGSQATLTFGIANTNSVVIDSTSVASGEYAKFTASGLESKSFAEVKTDLSLNLVENTALSTWPGTTNITTIGTLAVNLNLAGNSILGTSVDINNAELQQLSNIATTTISGVQWGYLGALDQSLATTDSPTFAGLTLTGVARVNEFADDSLGGDLLTGAILTSQRFSSPRIYIFESNFGSTTTADQDKVTEPLASIGRSIGALQNGDFESGILYPWYGGRLEAAGTAPRVTGTAFYVDTGSFGLQAQFPFPRDVWVAQDIYMNVNDITSFTYRLKQFSSGTTTLIVTYSDYTTTTHVNTTTTGVFATATVTGLSSGKIIINVRWEFVTTTSQDIAFDNVVIATTQNFPTELPTIEFVGVTGTGGTVANTAKVILNDGLLDIGQDGTVGAVVNLYYDDDTTPPKIVLHGEVTGSVANYSIERNEDALEFKRDSTVVFSITSGNSIDLQGNSILGTSVDISNAELQQLSTIGATTISGIQWGFVGTLDQSLITTDNVTFNALTVTSIGGITQDNLVDKSLAETIAGLWTFSDQSSVIGSVTASNLLDKSAPETITGAYTIDNATGLTFNNQGAGGNPIFVANNAAQLLDLTGALTVSSGLVADTVTITAVTRHKSLGFELMLLKDAGGTFGWNYDAGNAWFERTGTTTGAYLGVQFPDGATITAVRVTGQEVSSGAPALTITLFQVTAATGAVSEMATVDLTATMSEVADTTIDPSLIDNDTYNYLIKVDQSGSSGESRLRNIQIDYTVTQIT